MHERMFWEWCLLRANGTCVCGNLWTGDNCSTFAGYLRDYPGTGCTGTMTTGAKDLMHTLDNAEHYDDEKNGAKWKKKINTQLHILADSLPTGNSSNDAIQTPYSCASNDDCNYPACGTCSYSGFCGVTTARECVSDCPLLC